jgi:polyisoprenyl-phosphate glycosyltransferase
MSQAIHRQFMTVICPVFNEEQTVPLFFSRILPVIEILAPRYKVDVLFLNNASTDGTYRVLQDLAHAHSFVYYISLSANVGYQRSLECGLNHAKGDLMAFIDVDCEDPPEMILDFIQSYEEGYDIVYGERIDRVENRFLKALRKLYYHIVRRVADEEIILYMAEFALFTAEVRDAIIHDRSSFPFIRSSIARVGFRRRGIPYKRQRRVAGDTHYNFRGMALFAVAGILSSSTLMLRLPIYSLPIWLIATGLLGAWYLRENNAWLLLANLLLFCAYIGGSLAFIALYVARTYKNGLGRPNFVVHRRFSHPQPD